MKTTISTTLTTEEYQKFKKIGLPWNRLIRMGVASINNNVAIETNRRLEVLEKAYGELRNKYYDLRQRDIMREMKQKEEKK